MIINKLLNKLIKHFFRRWYKTDRGKWHIGIYKYSCDNTFIPMCSPWAIWKIAATKNLTPPDNAEICKICKKLQDK